MAAEAADLCVGLTFSAHSGKSSISSASGGLLLVLLGDRSTMRLALQRQGGKLNHAAELLRRSDHAFRIFERAAFFFDDAAAGPQTGPQRTEPGIIPSEPPGFLNRVHRFNSCRGHPAF